jgi:hypothetical protein
MIIQKIKIKKTMKFVLKFFYLKIKKKFNLIFYFLVYIKKMILVNFNLCQFSQPKIQLLMALIQSILKQIKKKAIIYLNFLMTHKIIMFI